MENGIKVFERQEFGQVRVVDVDGEPWFVAKDVCDCLDLTNTAQTISYLDDDEKGVTTNYTPGGAQEMLISGYPYALRKIQRFQGR